MDFEADPPESPPQRSDPEMASAEQSQPMDGSEVAAAADAPGVHDLWNNGQQLQQQQLADTVMRDDYSDGAIATATAAAAAEEIADAAAESAAVTQDVAMHLGQEEDAEPEYEHHPHHHEEQQELPMQEPEEEEDGGEEFESPEPPPADSPMQALQPVAIPRAHLAVAAPIAQIPLSDDSAIRRPRRKRSNKRKRSESVSDSATEDEDMTPPRLLVIKGSAATMRPVATGAPNQPLRRLTSTMTAAEAGGIVEGCRVRLRGEDSLHIKLHDYSRTNATVIEIPVHPNTWFGVRLHDGTRVKIRRSAFDSEADLQCKLDNGIDIDSPVGALGPKATQQVKVTRRPQAGHKTGASAIRRRAQRVRAPMHVQPALHLPQHYSVPYGGQMAHAFNAASFGGQHHQFVGGNLPASGNPMMRRPRPLGFDQVPDEQSVIMMMNNQLGGAAESMMPPQFAAAMGGPGGLGFYSSQMLGHPMMHHPAHQVDAMDYAAAADLGGSLHPGASSGTGFGYFSMAHQQALYPQLASMPSHLMDGNAVHPSVLMSHLQAPQHVLQHQQSLHQQQQQQQQKSQSAQSQQQAQAPQQLQSGTSQSASHSGGSILQTHPLSLGERVTIVHAKNAPSLSGSIGVVIGVPPVGKDSGVKTEDKAAGTSQPEWYTIEIVDQAQAMEYGHRLSLHRQQLLSERDHQALAEASRLQQQFSQILRHPGAGMMGMASAFPVKAEDVGLQAAQFQLMQQQQQQQLQTGPGIGIKSELPRAAAVSTPAGSPATTASAPRTPGSDSGAPQEASSNMPPPVARTPPSAAGGSPGSAGGMGHGAYVSSSGRKIGIQDEVRVTVGRHTDQVGRVKRSGHGFYCVALQSGEEVMKRASELVHANEALPSRPPSHQEADDETHEDDDDAEEDEATVQADPVEPSAAEAAGDAGTAAAVSMATVIAPQVGQAGSTPPNSAGAGAPTNDKSQVRDAAFILLDLMQTGAPGSMVPGSAVASGLLQNPMGPGSSMPIMFPRMQTPVFAPHSGLAPGSQLLVMNPGAGTSGASATGRNPALAGHNGLPPNPAAPHHPMMMMMMMMNSPPQGGASPASLGAPGAAGTSAATAPGSAAADSGQDSPTPGSTDSWGNKRPRLMI